MTAAARNALAETAIKQMQSGDKTAFERFLQIDYMLIQKMYQKSNTHAFAAIEGGSEEYEMNFIEKLYNVLMRFDFTKGTQISTFLYSSMVLDTRTAVQGSTIIPVTMPIAHYSKIRAIHLDYTDMRDLGYDDIHIYRVLSEKYDMTPKTLRSCLAQVYQINSVIHLDEPVLDGEGSTFGELVADPNSINFFSTDVFDLQDFLQKCKEVLNEKQYYVLCEHLGLSGESPKNFRKIAEKMGMTYQGVQQIFHQAVKKAKRLMYTEYNNVAILQDGYDEDYDYRVNKRI